MATETRLALSVGGQFLACFQAEKAKARSESSSAFAREYAFAILVPGEDHTSAELDKLQAVVTAQWKDFKPLNSELPANYLVYLNQLVKDASGGSSAVSSIKPTLVSINRLDAHAYSVLSIRRYSFSESGQSVSTTVVSAGAVVLRGKELIRLNMQKPLTATSDVSQLGTEVSDWVKAVEEGSLTGPVNGSVH